MIGYISKEVLRDMSNEELVSELIYNSIIGCEMNNREKIEALKAEVLRRMKS